MDRTLSHVRESSLLKRSDNKSFLLTPEASQVMSLEQQVTILNSRLQEQSDLLSKERVSNQRLAQANATQIKQLDDANK